MTKSEELTNLISAKFFLNQYVYKEIYVKKGKQKSEFCDCLLEFDSFYIVIQIKEKNEEAESTAQKWFEKKVIKKASSQIKDSFLYFEDDDNEIFTESGDLTIDRKKHLIPVIVFLASGLCDYRRVKLSQSLNRYINIFSYDDFKTMLESIILPYDVLSYLQFRVAFENVELGKLAFGELTNELTVLTTLKSEKDFSDMYLVKTYYSKLLQGKISEGASECYNEIVANVNKARGEVKDGYIEGLLCVNHEMAHEIALYWEKMLEISTNHKFIIPKTMAINDILYVWCTKPLDMSMEEFSLRLQLVLVYRHHQLKVKRALIITMAEVENQKVGLGIIEKNLLTDIPTDPEYVESVISFFEDE